MKEEDEYDDEDEDEANDGVQDLGAVKDGLGALHFQETSPQAVGGDPGEGFDG